MCSSVTKTLCAIEVVLLLSYIVYKTTGTTLFFPLVIISLKVGKTHFGLIFDFKSPVWGEIVLCCTFNEGARPYRLVNGLFIELCLLQGQSEPVTCIFLSWLPYPALDFPRSYYNMRRSIICVLKLAGFCSSGLWTMRRNLRGSVHASFMANHIPQSEF
jgi:hypothetical protein